MASSKVLNYGVDAYTLKLNDNASFTIDTGAGLGEVTITGDLSVTGEITQTEVNEVVVRDRTITVNDGESANGISAAGDGSKLAGLIVDRGNLTDASIIYDEKLSFYNSEIGTEDANSGAFALKIKANDTGGFNGGLVGLYTNFIGTHNDTDLVLIGAQDNTGKVTVTNTVNYERNIFPYTGANITLQPNSEDKLTPVGDPNFDDDAIPNVRLMIDYIRGYHQYNFQDEIRSETDTSVKVSDYETDSSQVSQANVIIDGNEVATFKATKINFTDLEFELNQIQPVSTNGNLVLRGNTEGKVQFDTPLTIPKYTDLTPGETDPDAPTDGVTIYTKEEADGGTGLFFINENSTQDEVISRNKALLYSIIF
jgi:hypothetical protein